MQYNRSLRTGETGDAPVHPQDFPRIARELGFNFTLRRGRVDWHKIDSINVDRLVQECDLTTLHNNLINVVNYNLDREYDVKILDHNFVKLFKLAQLSIDYLLYAEQHLFNCVDVLYKENNELKSVLSIKENSQRNQQIKSRKKYGQQPITSYKESNEYFKCHYCGKTFLSDNYLSAHILRRHPSPSLTDQGVETNVLQAEINELKNRLKLAEELKHENQSKPDVSSTLRDWQENLQVQYREEMMAIKNMFINEIKKLKETRLDVDHLPSKENKDLLEKIQKQEQELNTIRERIQDNKRTAPELETLRGQLEAQERFWKSRLNEAQSKHTEDIAELKAQLSELTRTIETQATLQEVADHSKEHDKRLAFQGEQISKIAQRSEVLKSNTSMSISTLPPNCLIDLEDDLSGRDKIATLHTESKMSEVPSTVSSPIIFLQPTPDSAKISPKVDLDRNLHLVQRSSSQAINVKPQELNVGADSTRSTEDNESVVREMSFSDSSISEGERGNAQRLNVLYFSTKLPLTNTGKKKKSPEDSSRKQAVAFSNKVLSTSSNSKQDNISSRNSELPERNKQSDSASSKQELPTISDRNIKNQKTVVSEPKNETLAKNSTPKSFAGTEIEIQQRIEDLTVSDTQDSSSDSSADSESTITEESAVRDAHSELTLHTVESMENALAKNPQIFDAIKDDIVKQFENRLRELAIDPQWQGIPTANYNKNLATLQHHESISAKKCNSFFKIKQDLVSSLDDRLGLQKNVNSSSDQTKDRESHKLFKSIPGATRDLLPDVRNKKNSEKKVPPPRPPSIFPKRDQKKLALSDLAKSPPLDEDTITPFKNLSGSQVVTSTPLKDEDMRYNARTKMQNLADGDKASRNSSPLRLGSFDGNIDSLLNEPVKSPLRKFTSPVSKSQDFLDRTPKTSREISPRSVLKGALSTGSLVTKKRVVFSDQDEFNLSEARKSNSSRGSSNVVASTISSKKSLQRPDKLYSGFAGTVDRNDQDSYTDSDFDLSSNKEEDSPPMARSKEPAIKLSTQQSNKIAQISHSIETQLRDASRLKPVGGIEAIFQSSSPNTNEKNNSDDGPTRRKPVPQPRKSDGTAAKELNVLSDDWDLEDVDDLLLD